MLVGPKQNPAKLDGKKEILTLFANLHDAAEKGAAEPPVRLLSRYDKSATNIKDSELFLSIGQVSSVFFQLLTPDHLIVDGMILS